jgi:hypothetical protein
LLLNTTSSTSPGRSPGGNTSSIVSSSIALASSDWRPPTRTRAGPASPSTKRSPVMMIRVPPASGP